MPTFHLIMGIVIVVLAIALTNVVMTKRPEWAVFAAATSCLGAMVWVLHWLSGGLWP